MANAERMTEDGLAGERNGGAEGAAASNGSAVGVLGGNGFGDSEVGAIRAELVEYLRARFRGTLDHDDVEDIAQGAWETVLRKQLGGEAISDLAGYLRTIAWRDARDLIRDRREASTDPADGIFAEIADREATAEERLERRVDLAHAIEAVEQLSAEHRAAYRVRFFEHLSTEEACERLGLPRSTYRHRLRRAVDTVSANLDDSRFARLQRTLLGAYIAGVASAPERRRAELLIRTDPRAAATARELRAAHESTAAALTPIAIEPDASVGVVERLLALPDRIREHLPGGGGRSAELGDAASSSATIAAGTRGSGAAAGGALAKLAGLGGAGKIATACIGTGAAATACVAAGVVPGIGPDLGGKEDRDDKPPAKVVEAVEPTAPAPLEESKPITLPEPTPAPEQDPESEPDASPEQEPAAPDPAQTAAPTAPASEQEFGVVSATAPQPTPSSTGGGSGSSGGGGSAVQREFGP